ncbi:MAG: hypothetical protein ACI9YM_001553 [Brevundimonas sp.]|jgi:uncharacterized protein (TIGR00369 family)|uniref:PaaI family thioesterase n=1 Tax=Brevundimonas sp. TaxID=1871086 RepID=UPI0039E39F05
MAEADRPALSGLEQLQQLLSGLVPPIPIAVTLDFRLIELEAGRVVFAGTPGLAVYNPIGTVHGGWIAAILDSACGCAVHSGLRPGQAYTSLELKTVFHRALTADVPVRAEGRLVQIGGRAGFAEADLRGLDGTLYATATSTCLVIQPR